MPYFLVVAVVMLMISGYWPVEAVELGNGVPTLKDMILQKHATKLLLQDGKISWDSLSFDHIEVQLAKMLQSCLEPEHYKNSPDAHSPNVTHCFSNKLLGELWRVFLKDHQSRPNEFRQSTLVLFLRLFNEDHLKLQPVGSTLVAFHVPTLSQDQPAQTSDSLANAKIRRTVQIWRATLAPSQPSSSSSSPPASASTKLLDSFEACLVNTFDMSTIGFVLLQQHTHGMLCYRNATLNRISLFALCGLDYGHISQLIGSNKDLLRAINVVVQILISLGDLEVAGPALHSILSNPITQISVAKQSKKSSPFDQVKKLRSILTNSVGHLKELSNIHWLLSNAHMAREMALFVNDDSFVFGNNEAKDYSVYKCRRDCFGVRSLVSLNFMLLMGNYEYITSIFKTISLCPLSEDAVLENVISHAIIAFVRRSYDHDHGVTICSEFLGLPERLQMRIVRSLQGGTTITNSAELQSALVLLASNVSSKWCSVLGQLRVADHSAGGRKLAFTRDDFNAASANDVFELSVIIGGCSMNHLSLLSLKSALPQTSQYIYLFEAPHCGLIVAELLVVPGAGSKVRILGQHVIPDYVALVIFPVEDSNANLQVHFQKIASWCFQFAVDLDHSSQAFLFLSSKPLSFLEDSKRRLGAFTFDMSRRQLAEFAYAHGATCVGIRARSSPQ
jgi:hypothetical protein